ncbi:uncharacterized protein KGF55_003371 [Candida pseudojiufengensis]|uniref:uncharacterized protein n=1 Tax=Candida pseudojiufengensis TaxID=497109 RepID=UPI002223FB90|nr:uncharacterized protein KGF55_003371 [Candida pseudojiufengensis]KAI5962295.1 hypothetical protein KGF55_003371 [Candida pseudojiufengensis]
MPKNLKNCLLSIKNANFKSTTLKNAPFIFKNNLKSFQINNNDSWLITGPSKTLMLKIIAGEFISFPALSRTYSNITELSTQISFLSFKDKSGLDTVHMSARYESYSYKGVLEMSDDVNSVFNYITGLSNYNTKNKTIDSEYIEKLLNLFNLNHLQKKWINSLSNGQLRRARIAKALMTKPKLLIIDDPFLGLDPSNTEKVSEALHKVNEHLSISIVIGLREQDAIPKWIKNTAYADEEGIKNYEGSKKDIKQDRSVSLTLIDNNEFNGPNHIEFANAKVAYKDLVIFKDFDWKIPKGSKWRIMGDNGTGKTTLLSLITADHPQSWRSVLKINNKLRKTGSGITFFDVNNEIGMSSPELHTLVPQHKTMLDIIYNGLVPNIGNSNYLFQPKVKSKNFEIFDRFKDRIEQYGNTKFVDLSMTDQKLALFLRALIKEPEILILDEAFSCMEDENVMKRCHKLLLEDKYKDLTILSIGHLDWEINKYDYMIKLTGDDDRNYEIYKVEHKIN